MIFATLSIFKEIDIQARKFPSNSKKVVVTLFSENVASAVEKGIPYK